MDDEQVTAHIPVLFFPSEPGGTDIFQILKPKKGETVLDVTLGLGGHAGKFWEAVGPTGHLIALDADAANIEAAKKNLPSSPNIRIEHRNFRDVLAMPDLQADILFADLGVSSPHFDDPERGFSFRHSSPLDMRYDRTRGETASDFLRTAREEKIFRVLADNGELRGSKRLSNALYSIFHASPQDITTDALRGVVEKTFGYRAPFVLPQIFQALRIRVNDELGALSSLLAAIPKILHPGGRAGIISFHSLEDRMVKTAFRSLCTPVKDPSTGAVAQPAPFELLTKKPLVPSEKEVAHNPRARSAKFRAIRRVFP